MDIIPEIYIPYLGWIDDGMLIGALVYYMRYGKLPNFNYIKRKHSQQPNDNKKSADNSWENSNTYTEKTPYEILQIDPKASKKQIHQAYKKMIKKYHPDKVSHLGDEFIALANRKFKEIQNAYDKLIGS